MSGINVGEVFLSLKLDSSNIDKQLESVLGGAKMKKAAASVGKSMKKSSVELTGGLTGVSKGILQVRKSAMNLAPAVKMLGAFFATKKIVDFTRSALAAGSALEEVQNVVEVTFGSLTDDVDTYSKSAIKTLGLSEKMTKEYMGLYGAMAKAYGFGDQATLDMSKTLTRLTSDVASFYDIDPSVAYTRLKSVFTGETEAIKRLGIVMTQNALDQFAMERGYQKTTKAMTEQEKVALRYAFVQDRLKASTGDFIRTQGSWANQTRILKLQWENFKTSIGQGLIAVFTPTIQMINTLMAQMIKLGNAFQRLMLSIYGKKESGVSGLGKINEDLMDTGFYFDDVGDAAVSTGKKISKSIMGFDKLNVLTDTSTAGGASGGTGGGASGGSIIPSIEGVDLQSNKLKEIEATLSDSKKYVEGISLGLAGMTVAGLLKKLKLAKLSMKEILGIGFVITGTVVFTKTLAEIMQEELTSERLRDAVLGGGLIVGGLFLLGLKSGLKTALTSSLYGVAAAAIGLFFVTARDMIKNGFNNLNYSALLGVGAVGGGAIGFLIGGPLGAAIGALTGFILAEVISIGVLFKENWTFWKEQWGKKWGEMKTKASEVWTDIKTQTKGSLNEMSGFFKEIGNTIKTYWSETWTNMKDNASKKWGEIKTGVSSTWTTLKSDTAIFCNEVKNGFSQAWGSAKTSVTSNLSSIKTGASNAFTSVKGSLSGLGNWVSSSFSGVWSKAWTSIVSAFNKIWAGLANGLKSPINSVISMINKVITAINKLNINIPDWVPSLGGKSLSFNIPSIPMLADGGYVRANTPQLAIVGDNKREGEIIAPESKITEAVSGALSPLILTLRQLVQQINEKGGGGGDITIPIYLDGNIIDKVVLSANDRRRLRSGGYA